MLRISFVFSSYFATNGLGSVLYTLKNNSTASRNKKQGGTGFEFQAPQYRYAQRFEGTILKICNSNGSQLYRCIGRFR
jgi:hypothetical protein